MFHSTDTWLHHRLGAQMSARQLRCGWPPSKKPKIPQLFYQLIQVRPHANHGTGRRLPLVFSVDYLLIPHAVKDTNRQELLGKAALAVAEDPELSFSNEPLPGELHIAAQTWIPYLRVQTLWRHERPIADAPMVEHVDINHAPQQNVSGILLGPTGKPMAGEAIRIPAHARVSHSDEAGIFHFPALHHHPGRELTFSIRGRLFPLITGKRSLTIHYTPKEP